MSDDLIRTLNRIDSRLHALETLEMVPVVARYSTNAGQSFNSGSTVIIDFEDLSADTWSAVTVGASWKFTAPLAGYYAVSVLIEIAATTAWAAGERAAIELYKNNALYALLYATENNGAASHTVALQGDDVIHLALGDYIDVRLTQASGSARTLVATTENNHISIVKVG